MEKLKADFNGFPLLEFQTFYAKEWQLFIKRLLDIFVSLAAVIFFSPLIVLAALLIRITSNGPVFSHFGDFIIRVIQPSQYLICVLSKFRSLRLILAECFGQFDGIV